jgi:hypothetical protein
MSTSKKEKNFVRKALESISAGNATGLKKNIKEALLLKVKKALHIKEKELATKILNQATKK